jgi:processive 1,2-diacylglycerol beta-glucosyltransferase
MRVLVLHASFGSGHKRAGQALVEAFQDKDVPAELRDLLEFLPAPMAKFYSSAYEFMITKSRGLWRLTYNLVNAPKSSYCPGSSFTQRWQFQRLKEFLQHGPFTHVISTHFTPSALLADWRASQKIALKTFSVITDHEAHRCWKRTGLDHYFVASERVASEMQQIGVPETAITISGIPISKQFSVPISRMDARQSWNLPEDGRVVLVMCSAVTTKKSIQMLDEFASIHDSIRYLVIAGADKEKEETLKKRFETNSQFTIFGFTTRVAEMMTASDLVVTKPGGLIVSEALAVGLPQILLEPIPGQEEANAQYSVDRGAAICVRHRTGVYRNRLRDILSDPVRLLQMSEAAQRAAKPGSAEQVTGTILSRFVVS